jgi:hypothetical protein
MARFRDAVPDSISSGELCAVARLLSNRKNKTVPLGQERDGEFAQMIGPTSSENRAPVRSVRRAMPAPSRSSRRTIQSQQRRRCGLFRRLYVRPSSYRPCARRPCDRTCACPSSFRLCVRPYERLYARPFWFRPSAVPSWSRTSLLRPACTCPYANPFSQSISFQSTYASLLLSPSLVPIRKRR